MDYYYTICFLSLIYILEALYDIPLTMITTCTSPSSFLRYPIIPLLVQQPLGKIPEWKYNHFLFRLARRVI